MAPFQPIGSSRLGAGIQSTLAALGKLSGGGDLIAGGTFSNVNGVANAVSNIGRFDGTLWNPLGAHTAGATNAAVSAVEVFNGVLYAGGLFTQIGGVAAARIARYDAALDTWVPLGTGVTGTGFTRVNALISFGGLLFVGGIFDTAGGIPVTSIAAWDGSTWVDVGNPGGLPAAGNQPVNSFINFNGELFAGGDFNSTTGKVARYLGGTSWSLPTGFFSTGNNVDKLAVFAGNLYALGSTIISAGGFGYNVAKYNGVSFAALRSGGLSGAMGGAIEFLGQFLASDSSFPDHLLFHNPAVTSGPSPDGTWQIYPVGGGMSGSGTANMIIYNGLLVADGGTKNPGGIGQIASYSGVGNWVPVGTVLAAGETSCYTLFNP